MKRKRRWRKRKTWRRRKARRVSYLSKIPEVKWVDYAVIGKGLTQRTDLAGMLYSTNKIAVNPFEGLGMGTTWYQRIGTKVFLKSINVRAAIRTCGYKVGADWRDVNAYLLRLFWLDDRSALDQQCWTADVGNRIAGRLNRKLYTIHHDRVWSINGGWANTQNPADSSFAAGGLKFINYTVKVNRFIEFTMANTLKHDTDVYTLGVAVMDSSGLNNVVPACGDFYIRFYYTDA